jgi:hypothetical protein
MKRIKIYHILLCPKATRRNAWVILVKAIIGWPVALSEKTSSLMLFNMCSVKRLEREATHGRNKKLSQSEEELVLN